MTDPSPSAPSPAPDGDPGHLFTDAEWVEIQARAQAYAPRSRLLGLLAAPAGPTVLVLPARFHGGPQAPALQVIHSAETPLQVGYARAIGEMFAAGPAAGTSAHVMVDPATVARMLAPTVVGYHVGPVANLDSIGYEQAGYAAFTRAEWTTPDGLIQLDVLAAELAADGIKYGIPDRHLTDAQLAAWHANGRRLADGGRCTHDQVHRVLGGTTHTDPMPNYPLDELNAAVTQHRAGPTPTPPEEDMLSALNDDQQVEVLNDARDTSRRVAHIEQIVIAARAEEGAHAAALASVIQQLQGGEQVDMAAVKQAAQDGAAAALANIQIVVTTAPADPPAQG